MTASTSRVHRLSGTQPPPQDVQDKLRVAQELHGRGVLRGSSIELLQTLVPMFPDASAEALASAALLLQAQDDGHTCLHSNTIAKRWTGTRYAAQQHDQNTANTSDIDGPQIDSALTQSGAFSKPWDASHAVHPPNAPIVKAFDRYYLHRSAVTEHGISTALRERIATPHAPMPKDAVEPLLAALREHMEVEQLQAVTTALSKKFMLLTGGPGTGKTWTVRTLLAVEYAAALRQNRPLPRVSMAAPTGKAAARMLESIHGNLEAFIDTIGRKLVGENDAHLDTLRQTIEHLDAQTLHRLLGVYRRGSEETYVHADIVIVDEVSMVDAPMMHRLLASIDTNTRLILIGDPHQLASVEAGSVLSDFVQLASDTPEFKDYLVELTTSRRFTATSLVGQLAKATLNNQPHAEIWTHALRLLPEDEPQLSQDLIEELAEGFLPLMHAAEARQEHPDDLKDDPERDARALRSFEALSAFQILCAHHHGPRSVRAMNEAITRALLRKEHMHARGAGDLSVGMPIMIQRNDYSLKRYNGDIGVVTAPGIVSFPTAEGGVQHISVSRLPEHAIAFAITVHKSQGSEWEHVAVLFPPQPSRILTRELVYTAISRARETIEIFGSSKVLAGAIVQKANRATGLVDVVSAQLRAHPLDPDA